MTWSYDVTALQTNTTYQIRFTIGDTQASDPQLQDEEIAFALSQRSSIYGAAADCCRVIAAGLAREADSVQGELRTLYSARSRAYAAAAARFDNFAVTRGAAMPYTGGISISDKVQQETNNDRVPPNFNIGMEDNYLPVAAAGNEGTITPSGAGAGVGS